MDQLPMPKDIIHEIILHMESYKELYNFVKAINYLNIDDKIVKELGKKLIMKRLKQLRGLDVDVFCQQLIENECIISGSFPLQCLLGEEWEGSDIDIYSKEYNEEYNIDHISSVYEPTQPIEFYLWNLYVDNHECDNLCGLGNGNLHNKHPECEHYAYDPLDIAYVVNYHIYNKNIQAIIVDKDVEEHVMKDYDLTFCQIIFNGKEIKFDQSWIDIALKIGILRELYQANILKRIGHSKKASILRRIKKYNDRGFKIYSENKKYLFSNVKEIIQQIHYDRDKKYHIISDRNKSDSLYMELIKFYHYFEKLSYHYWDNK